MKNNFSRQFVLTSDNIRVAFIHCRQGFSNIVIIAHGFYNSKDAVLLKELARELMAENDVIALDFRGHGQSGGLFYWTSREYLDLLAVLEYIKGQYKKIGVIGFSLGAAITIITAAKTGLINSVIAVSCPTAFEQIEYQFWKLNPALDIKYNLFGKGRAGKGVRPGPFWLRKEKPLEIVEHIQQPVLYIHGTRDWLIKPGHSQSLYDQTVSGKKLEIIENGPHAEYLLLTHPERFLALIREWLDWTLR